MARKSLPPGFRFHPTDVELVLYYLKRKVMGKKLHYEAVAEVNIYKFSPWDLPVKSHLKSKDLEWFFFCPREKKYASGSRVKRATENGYWKTTGKDRNIRYNDRTVGAVKTLVFHLGHAPQGERTDWVIHEYRILDDELAAAGVQDTYVLCKVFKKNGLGPKNGSQYGAPFNEADWADDVDGAENHDISLGSDGPSLTVQEQTQEQSSPFEIGLLAPGSTFGLPVLEEGPPPSARHPTSEVVADVTDNEMLHLFAPFTDEDTLLSYENGITQDDLSRLGMNNLVPCSEGQDIYNGLGDLDTLDQIDQGRLDFSWLQNDESFLNNMLPLHNSAYIELDDLLPPLDFSVTGADQPSLGVTPGGLCHENVQQLYSEDRSAGMGQYASGENGLPLLLPKGSYEDHCLVVPQMADQQIYRGANAPYDLSFAFVEQENKGHPNTIMERGARILVDCNPARLPTAALLYTRNGGSSIHIKAEVTHRAGERTNEALSVMMGGSGSCWCTKHPGAVLLLLVLLVVNQLSKTGSIFYYSLVSLSVPPRRKQIYSLACLFIVSASIWRLFEIKYPVILVNSVFGIILKVDIIFKNQMIIVLNFVHENMVEFSMIINKNFGVLSL